MDRLGVWDRNNRVHDFEDVWHKQAVFLMVNGPSLSGMPLELLDQPGIMTAGVNNGWVVRRPDFWFSCDDPGCFIDTGWKDPRIMKFCPRSNFDKKLLVKVARKEWKESVFTVRQMPNVWGYERYLGFDSKTFFDGPKVNWGCNGKEKCSEGYQGSRSTMLVALRMLVWMGFKRIYILGADFHMESNEKAYAFDQCKYGNGATSNNNTYSALNVRLRALGPGLAERGVKVVNVSEGGNLQAFPRDDFASCVEREARTCGKPVDPSHWYLGRGKKAIRERGTRRGKKR